MKAYHRRPEHRGRKSDARATRERARILEAFEAYHAAPAEYRTRVNGVRHVLMLDKETGATVLAPVER